MQPDLNVVQVTALLEYIDISQACSCLVLVGNLEQKIHV